jgi:hypothetical protein
LDLLVDDGQHADQDGRDDAIEQAVVERQTEDIKGQKDAFFGSIAELGTKCGATLEVKELVTNERALDIFLSERGNRQTTEQETNEKKRG